MLSRFFIFLLTIVSLSIPATAFAVTPQLPAGCSNVVSMANSINNPAQKKAFEAASNPGCFPPNSKPGTTGKTGMGGLLATFSAAISQVQSVIQRMSLSIYLTLLVFTIIVGGVKIAFGSTPPMLGVMKMAISTMAVYALVVFGPAILDGVIQITQGQGYLAGVNIMKGIKQSYQAGHGGLINSTTINSLPAAVYMDPGNIVMEGINVAALFAQAVQASPSAHWYTELQKTILTLGYILTVCPVYLVVFCIVAVEAAWLVIETQLIVVLSSIIFSIAVLDVYRSHINKVFEVIIKQCLKILVLYIILALGYAVSNAAIQDVSLAKLGNWTALFEMVGMALLYGMIAYKSNAVADIVFTGTTGSAVSHMIAIMNNTTSVRKAATTPFKNDPNSRQGKVGAAFEKGVKAVVTKGASLAKDGAKKVGKAITGGSQEEKANVPGPNTVDSNSKTPPPGNPRTQNSPANLSVPPASFSAPKNTPSAPPPSTPPPSTPSGGSSGPEPKKEK